MKKLISTILSFSIIASLGITSHAVSSIEESSDHIVVIGEDDECGHYPPAGYRFIQHSTGNTYRDAQVLSVMTSGLVTIAFPYLPNIPSIVYDLFCYEATGKTLEDGTKVYGDYSYEEYWNDPDSWFHYKFQLYDDDGNYLGYACFAKHSYTR